MTQTKKLNLIFLLTVVVYIGGSLLYSILTAGLKLSPYIDLLVSELLVVIPAAAYVKIEKRSPGRVSGNRGLAPWSIVCLIGITILIMPLLAFLNLISSLLAGNAAADITRELAGRPMFLNFLFLAVLPALCEEFVFRGVMFQGYRRHGLWKAVLISGLFFGLLHLNFNQFSYGFALGAVFAVLVEATGSLLASMLVHFMINFQTVAMLDNISETALQQAEGLQLGFSAYAEQASVFMMVAITGIAAIVTTALAVLLIRKLAQLNGREDYMRWVLYGGERRVLEKRPREPVADVYFLAGVAICLAFMVYQLF